MLVSFIPLEHVQKYRFLGGPVKLLETRFFWIRISVGHIGDIDASQFTIRANFPVQSENPGHRVVSCTHVQLWSPPNDISKLIPPRSSDARHPCPPTLPSHRPDAPPPSPTNTDFPRHVVTYQPEPDQFSKSLSFTFSSYTPFSFRYLLFYPLSLQLCKHRWILVMTPMDHHPVGRFDLPARWLPIRLPSDWSVWIKRLFVPYI